MLEVPGDPVEAVTVFDEADPGDDDLRLLEGPDAGGDAWAGGEIATAGGYYLELVAQPMGEGTSAVLVTECGD